MSEIAGRLPAGQPLKARLLACLERAEAAGASHPYLALKEFTANVTWFKYLELIPHLTAFYDWLNRRFANRETMDSVMGLTIVAALRKVQNAQEADRWTRVFDRIVELWNSLHAHVGGALDQDGCALHQFPALDKESTTMGLFLTYRDNETNDVLIKVCHFICVPALAWWC